MIHCVEIAQNAKSAEGGATDEPAQIISVDSETFSGTDNHDQCEKESNEISEETLLN